MNDLYFTKGLKQVTHCEWKIVFRHNSTICQEIRVVLDVFRNQTEQLEHIHTLLLLKEFGVVALYRVWLILLDVFLRELAVGLVYCGLEILFEPLIDELLAASNRLGVHVLLSDVRFSGLGAIHCYSHVCVGLSIAHHLEGSRVQLRLKAGCQFFL